MGTTIGIRGYREFSVISSCINMYLCRCVCRGRCIPVDIPS